MKKKKQNVLAETELIALIEGIHSMLNTLVEDNVELRERNDALQEEVLRLGKMVKQDQEKSIASAILRLN